MIASSRAVLVPGDRHVPWMHSLPTDWPTVPLKHVVKLNAAALSNTTDPDYELKYIDISSVNSNGEVMEAAVHRFADAPSRARRVVRSGDTMVSTVRTYLRAIAFIEHADENLVCSTGFAVLTPTPVIDPRFLAYWCRSTLLIDEVVARSTGVSYPAINPAEIGSLPVPRIPLDEQRAIADYLDEKTAAIDALIAKRERHIELLKVKRRSTIDDLVLARGQGGATVTRSPIPGIGEIPAHWGVVRLKYLGDVRTGITKGRAMTNTDFMDVPYLRVANVQDGYLDLDDIATIPATRREIQRFALLEGDLLMNEGGDNDKLGRGTVWEGQIDLCLHQNHVFAVRPHRGVDPYWIDLVTQTSYMRHFFLGRANQSTNLASISATNVKEAPIVMPPPEEQASIIDAVRAEQKRLDRLTQALKAQIQSLREYRQTLISVAVTGQLPVREEMPA